ncbi:unnamed protein product [marine sediment metagenome]|uniref:F5/8 type C domain-containing protein n=1 Tax=marine sediment metagenome TaxID=412755 RepID=X1R1V7_9ZZZZ
MAIKTLRPNAAGDETNITYQFPDSTFHWDKVDEEVADDETTKVYIERTTLGTTEERDLYALPDPAGLGLIAKVTVHFRARADVALHDGISYSRHMHACIKTHETIYKSGNIGGTDSWAPYSYDWEVNPFTGFPWTRVEIDALQLGVELYLSVAGGDPPPTVSLRCTQVYVEVDYTPSTWENIDGATTDPYNDTGAPSDGSGGHFSQHP